MPEVPTPAAPALPPPLPGATRRSLVRIAIRVRGSSVTTAGWRLELDAPPGPGAIVLAEGGAASWFRGEGSCLGLAQERLAAVWAQLQPDDAREADTQQWG